MPSLFTGAHLILPTASGLVVKSTDSGGSFRASSYDSCMALGMSLCISFLICRMMIKENITDTSTQCCCEGKVTVRMLTSLLDVGWTSDLLLGNMAKLIGCHFEVRVQETMTSSCLPSLASWLVLMEANRARELPSDAHLGRNSQLRMRSSVQQLLRN